MLRGNAPATSSSPSSSSFFSYSPSPAPEHSSHDEHLPLRTPTRETYSSYNEPPRNRFDSSIATSQQRRPCPSPASSPSRSPFQDYHHPVSEYHSGFSDVQLATSRVPSHHRQQSFPNLIPLPFRDRGISPERQHLPRPQSVIDMPYTGESRRTPRGSEASRAGGLSGWFSSGSSPTRGDRTPNGPASVSTSRDPTPEATPVRPRRSVSGMSDASTKTSNPAPSRFALFTNSMAAAVSRLRQAPLSPAVDDEIMHMNVEAALFPAGSPTERDTYSPAAFKNLQANATGLLTKMQSAYRQKSTAFDESESEKSAQKEELEESRTRVDHLKIQLEGMARRASEQEDRMKALMAELAAEKRANAHEKMLREKGIAGITVTRDAEGSIVSEDLDVDEAQARHKWRKSLKSDGSFDTDEEESMEEESIFSRSRSPTIATGAFEGIDTPPPSIVASHPRVVALNHVPGAGRQPQQQPQQQQQKSPTQPMNAFQKLVKNVTGSREDDEDGSVGGCRNCKGQDASFAWNTVSLLRDENKDLKQRVGQLETAVDAALDMTNGLGFEVER